MVRKIAVWILRWMRTRDANHTSPLGARVQFRLRLTEIRSHNCRFKAMGFQSLFWMATNPHHKAWLTFTVPHLQSKVFTAKRNCPYPPPRRKENTSTLSQRRGRAVTLLHGRPGGTGCRGFPQQQRCLKNLCLRRYTCARAQQPKG